MNRHQRSGPPVDKRHRRSGTTVDKCQQTNRRPGGTIPCSATFTRIYSYMCTPTRFFTRIYGASTRIYGHLCVFFRGDPGCFWRDLDDIWSVFARKRADFGTVARRPRRSIRACDCPDSTSRSRVSCRVGSKNRHPDCRRGKRTTCLRTASRMPAGSVCWRPAGALWVYGICTGLYGFCTVSVRFCTEKCGFMRLESRKTAVQASRTGR